MTLLEQMKAFAPGMNWKSVPGQQMVMEGTLTVKFGVDCREIRDKSPRWLSGFLQQRATMAVLDAIIDAEEKAVVEGPGQKVTMMFVDE